MILKNYDDSFEINNDSKQPCISDNPHKILITSGSGSAKANVLPNLIKNQQPDVEKICLYLKDHFGPKYQSLIKRTEEVRIKHEKKPKTSIHYSKTIDCL